MKAVILAGGLGTRLSEETAVRPKPMVEIGNMPILWHIMKIYFHHGISDFIICLGYKGEVIKDFFLNYNMRRSDCTFDFSKNSVEVRSSRAEPWRVTLVDTGDSTMTGGRLKRVHDYVKDDDSFCMTYGDGVGDVDVSAAIALHRSSGRMATVTAVQPPGRFGALHLEDELVIGFREKPDGSEGYINGGYFVLSPKVIDLIDGDSVSWEVEPMQRLAHDRQLSVYRHGGFWQPMDTLRDKNLLEEYWQSGKAPWKLWKD
jgi:glucose-1-phosphate cytidylyltransferase